MILSTEQRMEEAVQNIIVFAQFAAQEWCQDGTDASEVLCLAAARTFREKQFMDTGGSPEDWIANHFSQYMRECVLNASPVKL